MANITASNGTRGPDGLWTQLVPRDPGPESSGVWAPDEQAAALNGPFHPSSRPVPIASLSLSKSTERALAAPSSFELDSRAAAAIRKVPNASAISRAVWS